MQKIRVAVSGAYGKMGSETCKSIAASADLELAAAIVREHDPSAGIPGVPYYTNARECLLETTPDVLVDFTHANAAKATITTSIELGVRPVIGTTGFQSEELADLDARLRDLKIGGLYAPNFAIGALLMMKAATLIAPFLNDVEIIEYHHTGKKDAPSGTARKTAEKLALAMQGKRTEASVAHPGKAEFVNGIPIHSVRLPGYIAHQEVIFGGQGERLTIRHDTMSRESFMPGVLLGIRSIMNVTGLVDGLEHFLF